MASPRTLCVLRAFVVLSFLTVSARLSAADVPAIHWPPLLEHLTDYVWIDDEFPPGANLVTNKGDHAITWVESPVKSGSKAMLREADGIGQHYFTRSDEPLYASPEDSLFFWIHPDAETPPKAIMLQIHTHTWGHRVNWGDEDAINYGKKGTPQKHLTGPLPEAGTWTRLEIELRDLGITNGTKINGLAFTIAGGRAFWDRAGIRSVYEQPYKRPIAVAPDTLNLTEKAERYVWFDDDLPPGAAARTSSGNHPLRWTEDEPLSGARAMEREGESVEQHYFEDCQRPLTIGPDDTLSAWVRLDPLNPPTAIMLQYYSNRGWRHRACWGKHEDIEFGRAGTAEKVLKGDLPKVGEWVRLEVTAAELGLLPGMRVTGMAFTQHGGRVWWDRPALVTRVDQANPSKHDED